VRKKLTEKTGDLYHDLALSLCGVHFLANTYCHTLKRAFFIFQLFWTRVDLDKRCFCF
jgi:hypothetical protein